jgi:hypothetical protein
MQQHGTPLEGLEYGNAWDLRSLDQPHTNWLVGDHPAIPLQSLRFQRHGDPAAAGPAAASASVRNLGVKWFQHDPSDDPRWGCLKPTSTGRTLSLLASAGAFELHFQRGRLQLRLLLDQPGDFALWGEGLEHSWRALAPSTVMTLRWLPGPPEPAAGC